MGHLHLDAARYEQARECFLKLLDHESITPEIEALVWNNVAWADLMIGTPERMVEADRLSLQAFERVPWLAPVRGTRGSVLVELGHLDMGLEMLTKALKDNENAASKASNACYIALACSRKGRPLEAEEHLRQARKMDPKCLLIDRVTRELAVQ
jgi:tetratricopeptide (TPR) repeat protein